MAGVEDFPELAGDRRLRREARTVAVMADLACTELHGTPSGQLCRECRELLDYSLQRLAKCPFQGGKTTCANCRVHCYAPGMRERAKRMMRTAGPRMPLRHPLLALWHLLDGRRKSPARRRSR